MQESKKPKESKNARNQKKQECKKPKESKKKSEP